MSSYKLSITINSLLALKGSGGLRVDSKDDIEDEDSNPTTLPIKKGTRKILSELASKNQTYDDLLNEMVRVYARCICQHPEVLVIDLRVVGGNKREYAHGIVDEHFDSM